MTAIVFFLLACGLFGFGAHMMRHTSRYSRAGGVEFERRMKRRLIGKIFLVAGVMALGIVVLNLLAK